MKSTIVVSKRGVEGTTVNGNGVGAPGDRLSNFMLLLPLFRSSEVGMLGK
jgi:hypothetical protein